MPPKAELKAEPKAEIVTQFCRFIIIGLINTVVDFSVLNSATWLSGSTEGVGYAFQKGGAFIFAAGCSYFLNKRWCFEDDCKHKEGRKIARFLIISTGGLIINVAAATVTVTYLKPFISNEIVRLGVQVWVNIGALFGSASGLMWNFIGYKFIVFRK
ncbi:membrane protein containing GtrA-like protein domain protein [Candidatus Magnetoovum chiemensis]|nr:membrane protein containing GtrA-like protein domain protein [Candidatus Magnetoovum chiemensis]